MISSDILYKLIINLKNIPGWRTKRKIVVIECDDWGGIRIPSKKAYDILKKEGIAVPEGHFRYDTLESSEDLEALFGVLEKVKDSRGKSAVMSPITNVANPDFEKIRASQFKEYHYEKFSDTLLRYKRGPGVMKLWKEGIRAGIFMPELHGREHISVQFWLEELRKGNSKLLKAFDHEFVSTDLPEVKPILSGFRPEFYFENNEQKNFLIKSIIEGTELFKNIFGFQAQVFVPSNAVFHPDFEDILIKSGLRFLNTDHFSQTPNGKGGIKFRFCINGQRSRAGLSYYIRNCAFEPSSEDYGGTGLTLKQVAAAFRWQKPAIISTHRVNFAGGISEKNRKKGLEELAGLLKSIIHKWPDAEFMGSAEALNIMNEGKR